jgi:hypothetical protein
MNQTPSKDQFRLINPKLHSKLQSVGVVKFPFLKKDKVDEIRTLIDEAIPNWDEAFDGQFFLSVVSNDPELKKRISEETLKLIEPELNAHFSNYRCIVSLVLIKGPGEGSSVDFHQDLSICDEDKFSSYTLWIPLTPSTVENGAIRFLEYSHQIFRVVRSQTIAAPFDNVKDTLSKFMKYYPAEAGEAILWDQACIHQSPPNNSDVPRLALGITMLGADTPLQTYRYNESNCNMEIYSVPDDFWFRYADFVAEKKEVPSFGKLTETIPDFKFRDMTKKDIYLNYLPVKTLKSLL